MRKLILLSAGAAMVAVAPSLADAQGRGKGHGVTNTRGHMSTARGTRGVRNDHWVRGADGRWIRANPTIARGNPHGCPPGLANRNPPCVPPGQMVRPFHQGQRLPVDYRYYTDFNSIPLDIRTRFGIPTGQRYIYRDDTVYVVDPTTRLITSIIDILD